MEQVTIEQLEADYQRLKKEADRDYQALCGVKPTKKVMDAPLSTGEKIKWYLWGILTAIAVAIALAVATTMGKVLST